MTWANNIIKFRRENHFTQEELEKELGISRQFISKWENGETLPSIDNLIVLSGLLNISLDELITGEPYLNFPFHFGKPNNKYPIFILVFMLIFTVFCFNLCIEHIPLKVFTSLGIVCLLYLFITNNGPFDYKRYYQYWTITKSGLTFVKEAKDSSRTVLDESTFLLKSIFRNKNLYYVDYKEIESIEIILEPFKFNPDKLFSFWSTPRASHLIRETFFLTVITRSGETINLDLSSALIKESKEQIMLLTILSFFKRKSFMYSDKQGI
ncbi:helix-turn-helix domain-containing protein [Enterococcus sp. M190262]|uniref:helix-turn-helix domain-containing protein n=1 Tax=Enterococcus sp. M190262 TaxID=2582830 RepID=UPI0010FF75A4|nr:helix-turn-helix transcriptional regulator [Enterococcus sp. M190262]QCT93546.1 helix-turn-helix transcriptional regulator [Enterococcus sp. M190262]